MDVKSQPTTAGGVALTTTSGILLVGQGGAATLGYSASGTATSQLTVVQPGGGGAPANLSLASGEMQGLLSLRNTRSLASRTSCRNT